MCPNRFISCKKYAPEGCLIMRVTIDCEGQLYRKSLYCPLNFAVNMKLPTPVKPHRKENKFLKN